MIQRSRLYLQDMQVSALHARLQEAAGGRTYRHLGEITGTHPETVRRYLLGKPPSVEFVGALCSALAINLDWLLTGQGPMLARAQCEHALQHASVADLLHETARRLDHLQERLETIERYAEALGARFVEVESSPLMPDPRAPTAACPVEDTGSRGRRECMADRSAAVKGQDVDIARCV